MRNSLAVVALSSLLAVSGCASMPISSIVPLMQINIGTTRAEALRVAVQLPDGLRSKPGGVVMDLMLKRSGQPDTDAHFLLVDADAADMAGLSGLQQSGFRIAAYRLADTDVPRFKAVQEALAAAAQHTSGSLGFGIGAREFCLSGTAPASMLASTYLKTAESNGWVTVTDRFDLNSDARIVQALSALKAC